MNWQKFLFGRDFKNSKDFILFTFKAILFVVCVKSFFYANYKIPSSSMVPTLLTGDMILVNKYYYGFSKYSMPIKFFEKNGRIFDKRKPRYGDVVVFQCTHKNALCIKRLIGLSGDKIEIKTGRVYVNDKILEREFVDSIFPEKKYNENDFTVKRYIEKDLNENEYEILIGSDYSTSNNSGIYYVPRDHYFVMGDNRDNSNDSRFKSMSFIPKENIVGKAKLIYFSSSESIFKFWKLPQAIRYERLFKLIL